MLAHAAGAGTPYIHAVQQLAPADVATASAWLDGIITELWARSVALLPALGGENQ